MELDEEKKETLRAKIIDEHFEMVEDIMQDIMDLYKILYKLIGRGRAEEFIVDVANRDYVKVEEIKMGYGKAVQVLNLQIKACRDRIRLAEQRIKDATQEIEMNRKEISELDDARIKLEN